MTSPFLDAMGLGQGTQRRSIGIYLATALIAGALIALQITVMRIFSVGSWAHFGSLVISLAMLGFGLVSAVMCIADGWFKTHWRLMSSLSLFLFAPLTVACNLLVQQFPFNAIFLISDPAQKWRLALNMALYLVPFLSGALFLGVVFQQAQTIFNRVYFADLVGSGIGGLLLLASMYVLTPQDLMVMPLLLWLAGALFWFDALGARRHMLAMVVLVGASLAAHLLLPQLFPIAKIAISDYKGVSYARKFPDSQRVLMHQSPFGLLEVYSSSYLHFAPGLSDNAGFNLPKMPENAYLGLYQDSEGPGGIIRQLPADETAYYQYLPMVYPYLLKPRADAFVVQFGGGLSTALALASGSNSVTVAEGDRGVLDVFRHNKVLRDFTGDILNRPNVTVIDYDGRLYLAGVRNRFDVVDLSLADSAGLSSPGGFAIVEKFAYTREAMGHYMQALKPDGLLSVTIWNKEEPPKSVLKLYATMVAAARAVSGPDIAKHFFVVSSYLSTTTVLFKRDGFSDAETALLRKHNGLLSFDEIYSPGFAYRDPDQAKLLEDYRNQIFGSGAPAPDGQDGTSEAAPEEAADAGLPSTRLARLAWQAHVKGNWAEIARDYVFDTSLLTNAHPYFAAYIKTADLANVLDRIEILQDEWGYLLIWVTLGFACIAAFSLVLLPVVFGWRTIFVKYPGKMQTVVYFACLGLGYIMVEVSLIAHFVMALGSATISASVLITGMLLFSGIGSLVSERILPHARHLMPVLFVALAGILLAYATGLDWVLNAIGSQDYATRLLCCFALILPPAFLMGFPMPVAMTRLGQLGKEQMFIWAWGINGCFSVIGAALVPVISTSFGLDSVLTVSGLAYLLAGITFFAVLRPVLPVVARGA